MSLLAVESLGISFGGVRAVDAVSFVVEAGQVFSIIGPNGAGKTTLFNLVSGVYRSDAGRVHLADEDVTGLAPHALARRGLARTFQNLQIFFRMTVAENVMVGGHVNENTGIASQLLGLPAVARENETTRTQAVDLLRLFHLDTKADRIAGDLSYGELKRLEMARALALRPKVILLDEPAAGCNPTETAEIDEIIAGIARSGVAVVLVEHDMKLVMGISDRVLVLDQGRKLAEGSPPEIASNPAVIAAYLGANAGQFRHV